MYINEGVVIKTVDFKENSKIIYLLTKNGIDSCLVRAVKKNVSKDKASANVLTRISYNKTNSTGLASLVSFDVLNSYRYIKEDIDSLNFLSLLMEVIYKMQNQVTNETLYDFFVIILDKTNDGYDCRQLTDIFLMKYLYLLGLTPNMLACAECGTNENIIGFSIEKGGLCCSKHRSTDLFTDHDVILYLSRCYYSDVNKIDFEYVENALELIIEFYKYHLNLEFKSYEMIRLLKF